MLPRLEVAGWSLNERLLPVGCQVVNVRVKCKNSNCKVNKYTNENNNDCELLSTETNVATLINASALTLCINEESESSITNNHNNYSNLDDIIGVSIGGEGIIMMNKAHKNSISTPLAIPINRVYESQNILLKKLQAMDEKIKNIQNIQKRYFNQEVAAIDKQTLIDVTTER